MQLARHVLAFAAVISIALSLSSLFMALDSSTSGLLQKPLYVAVPAYLFLLAVSQLLRSSRKPLSASRSLE
ncbi:hypothetical protein [Cryobacterium sp. GrIS_2_6]|uniref:hypothetical protein n=1 Tax=Cryobacterium sp. GrIS_2_6 TaxID=3162785 RepID=UPI002DF849AE|nr:hypothetical protein [Cryobacterium psychrotolerans]